MSLQYAVLGLLNKNEMTGYDLKKIFEDDFLNANISQIYRELNALEKKGYLSSVIQPQQDRPDKRIYTITPSGKAAFTSWVKKFPDKLNRDIKDEFSLRLLFGSNLEPHELIQEFERLIKQSTKKLEHIKKFQYLSQKHLKTMAFFEAEEQHWKFILHRAEIALMGNISWAKDCINELLKERKE